MAKAVPVVIGLAVGTIEARRRNAAFSDHVGALASGNAGLAYRWIVELSPDRLASGGELLLADIVIAIVISPVLLA